MIYEYAVDPSLIIKLAEFPDLAWWTISRLGNGTSCVVSEYPQNLSRAVYKILKDQIRDAASNEEKIILKKKQPKVEELAAIIEKRHYVGMVKRKNPAQWNGTFEAESRRHPFDFILSESCAAEGANPIGNIIEWLRDPDSHLHQCPTSLLVSRIPADLGAALAPILKNAREITFIDPYFSPYCSGFCDAFSKYLQLIPSSTEVRGTLPRSVAIICNADAKFGNPPSIYPEREFKDGCEKELKGMIPSGIRLRIRRAREKRGKSNWHKLHNRFLLTDIGGVVFGHGIDSRNQPGDSSKDILSLLSAKGLEEIKNLYNPPANHFDWSEPVIEIP